MGPSCGGRREAAEPTRTRPSHSSCAATARNGPQIAGEFFASIDARCSVQRDSTALALVQCCADGLSSLPGGNAGRRDPLGGRRRPRCGAGASARRCGERFTTYERWDRGPALRAQARRRARALRPDEAPRRADARRAQAARSGADQIEELVDRIEAGIRERRRRARSRRRSASSASPGLRRARRRGLSAVRRRLRPRNFRDFGRSGRAGSVRARKEDAQSPRKAASEERD